LIIELGIAVRLYVHNVRIATATSRHRSRKIKGYGFRKAALTMYSNWEKRLKSTGENSGVTGNWQR
jgi:hypothetical protein